MSNKPHKNPTTPNPKGAQSPRNRDIEAVADRHPIREGITKEKLRCIESTRAELGKHCPPSRTTKKLPRKKPWPTALKKVWRSWAFQTVIWQLPRQPAYSASGEVDLRLMTAIVGTCTESQGNSLWPYSSAIFLNMQVGGGNETATTCLEKECGQKTVLDYKIGL